MVFRFNLNKEDSFVFALKTFVEYYQLEEAQIAMVEEFIKNVNLNQISAAKKALKKMSSFELQTDCKMIACIVLRDRTPLIWMEDVESLLFVSEKPYFGFFEKEE